MLNLNAECKPYKVEDTFIGLDHTHETIMLLYY